MKTGHQFTGHTNLIRAAYHSTRPPSYITTGLTMYLATRYWTSGANKVRGHSATILTYGQTIYLATPSLHRHYINRRPNTISGLTLTLRRAA